MGSPRFYLWTFLVLLSVVIVPLSASAAPPGDINSGNCIVLTGGGGTVTPNEDVNKRWFTIDGVIDRALEKNLTDSGYHVDELIVDIRDSSARMAALAQEQAKSGCKQVLRIGHELLSSSGSSGVVDRFGFEVLIGHLEEISASPHAVRFVSEYKQKYSYPLTADVMQHLSLSGVAQQIASDLAQAKVLLK